jgi:hypothetical protein
MAVLMNKEFLYCSVLECSTTTARVLFPTCEFTMSVVSQSWNVEVMTQPRGTTLGSVVSLLPATLYQGNPDRNHKF